MYTNWSLQSRQLGRLARRLSSSVAEVAPSGATSGRPGRPLPPPRVSRGPTDILRALAATVGHDPTAPHYKYHDDPYLIPQSNFRKRSHALAQEAGRKAAAWIRDQHADWFTTREWDPPTRHKTEHHNAEPRIPAYLPRPLYTDDTQVTIEDLRYTIDNARVEDAITVFRKLGGVTALDRDTAQSLLELLAFTREREPDSAEWLEERWYAGGAGRERRAAVWQTGGLAEEIFNSFEKKDSKAYCAIIQGMAKYHQAERAYKLSREALEQGVQLTAEVYDLLLGAVGFLKEGTELRVQMLTSLLEEMQQQGLVASSRTLSAALSSVAAWGGSRQLRQLALQLLAEFRAAGVRPALSAYASLLNLMCKERGPRTDVLSSILQDLESRTELAVEDAEDTKFFVTAMAVCNEHLQSMELADRVHALLMRADNYKLVGDAFRESIYYRHLLTLACRTAPLERTEQFLDQLVPNVYVPEPSVMEEIIKALEVGGAGLRLADVWSQLVALGHARRVKLVERLLEALCCSYYLQQEESVKHKMRQAARDILHHTEDSEAEKPREREPREREPREPRTPVALQLSASALADVIELCAAEGASAEQWAAAEEAARRLGAGQAAGVPRDLAPLARAAQHAVTAGHVTLAPLVLQYMVDSGAAEAGQACLDTLAAALNRSAAEVAQLLARPAAEMRQHVRPELVQVLELCRASGGSRTSRPGETTSDSDSGPDSSDSD